MMQKKHNLSVLLTTITGRVSLKTFIKYYLPIWLVFLLLAIGTTQPYGDIAPKLPVLFLIIYGFLAQIPQFCLFVKRLHDRNRSGSFILIGAIPLIGILILIFELFSPGDEGENQYGEPHSGEGIVVSD